MKKKLLFGILACMMFVTACVNEDAGAKQPCETGMHKDTDNDGNCDLCQSDVIVTVDFYNVNDLHGKIDDGTAHPGVDELTTYLKQERQKDDHAFFLSTGDMWQGSAESNMTNGLIVTDWMNHLEFTAMAIGNHDYDWGAEYVKSNEEFAKFPFLAINIYDEQTKERVEYCQPSVMVEADDVSIGIIGAIGDCYSSIASERTKGIYFKVRDELTELVKAESDRLRAQGADCIIYLIHDGYGESRSNDSISSSQIASYYDIALSDGYVDLVFEGHTHQGYILKDQKGVYHLQNRGDNYGGISHVELDINSANGKINVTEAELVSTEKYKDLKDDQVVEDLLYKYRDEIAPAYEDLGQNNAYRSSDALKQLVADLYYEAGIKKWGAEYEIALGGGFISIRSPYKLDMGKIQYEVLQNLLPFDNELVLCSIKGRDLKNYFIESKNKNYFTKYDPTLLATLDPEGTYYLITDTYTSTYQYAPKSLVEIERYGAGTYARDLLAEYAKAGGFE